MTERLDRRSFLKYSAALGAGVSATPVIGAVHGSRASVPSCPPEDAEFRWSEATLAQLQAAMSSGEATALSIVRAHIDRIERMDHAGPQVNSIIEVNPDAEAIAARLDAERAAGHVRGRLHGVPIVVKDSFATADRMETTAGSLALMGSEVPRDAGAVARLRAAGAIILGKANMSEFNAFRGWPLHGGWSGRAGMGLNPYALNYSTGDSSSGSAAAVAASFAAGALGLETYGSVMMPASLCGVVGLFPTRGLITRSGTIPISFSRDATGPIARTVADVAAMLNALIGADPLDPMSGGDVGRTPEDYTAFLDPGAMRGARIGVWRSHHVWKDEATAKVIERVLPVFRDLGASLVDPVEWPNWKEATGDHVTVMFSEFPHGVRRYLSRLSNTRIETVADIVAFNAEHPDEELRYHNQALLESRWTPLSDPGYQRALLRSERVARAGFAEVARLHDLDAIVAPTFVTPWRIDLFNGDPPENGNGAAGPYNAAGYPSLTVPAGYSGALPVGLSFIGPAWQEPRLLAFGYAFEQAVQARRPPRFIEGYGVRDFVER